MFAHWMNPNIWPSRHWLKGSGELAECRHTHQGKEVESPEISPRP